MFTGLIGVPVLGAILTGIGKATCFVATLPVETTENVKKAVVIGLNTLGINC